MRHETVATGKPWTLQICLLGAPRVILNGAPLAGLTSAKAQALLFYLAVTGQMHARPALAALLWGDMPEDAARGNLRKALQQLREHLGSSLRIERDAVGLAEDAGCWVDAVEFEELVQAATPPGIPGRLQRAAALYRGDFLEGFYVRDAPDFEDWWLVERARLREQMLGSLCALADHRAGKGDFEGAIAFARRLLEIEPSREDAHRRLMAWLAISGQRSAALAQYEICRRELAADLAVEPDEETNSLCQRIRRGDLKPPAIHTPPATHVPPVPHAGPRRPAFLDEPAETAERPQEPFVGRESQLKQLEGFMDAAVGGRGQVAFVSGEAGWGKTRLLAEFAGRAQQQHPGLIVAAGVCTGYADMGDPYLPFREILRTLSGDIEQGWAAGSITREHALRLWRFLPDVVEALLVHGRHLVDVLIPGELLLSRAAVHEAIAPQQRQRLQELAERGQAESQQSGTNQGRIFEEVAHVLHALSQDRPLLLILDDVHWADASSISLLFHLARRLSGSSILILGAYRPEEIALGQEEKDHPLAGVLAEFKRLFGNSEVELSQDEMTGRSFVDALLDTESNAFDEKFRRRLAENTRGHPLFTVETLQDLREQGHVYRDRRGRWVESPTLSWEALPRRVEGVIEKRISRLAPALRRALLAASVEGEDFTAEVVARVCGVEDSTMIGMLSSELARKHRLVEASAVRWAGERRISGYRFGHNLFQKYLYDQLDPIERARLHGAVGAALHRQVANDPAERERLGAQLAWHYEAAGQPLEAARALHDAGRQAMKVSALREALDRFDHALALLAGEPPSAERAEIERLLQTDQLSPQASVGGVGSSRLEKALALAGDAGAHAVHGRSRLLMLQAKADLLNARGQCEDGLAVADQMLEEATQCGDASFVANAHFWSGLFLHIMGKPQEAEERFELAIARLSPELDDDLRAAGGFELAPMVLSFSALNWWFLGYPERAQDRAARALSGAVARGDRFGQAFASALGSMTLFLLRSDAETLRARAEPGHLLCQHEGIGWWQDYLEILLGRLAMISGRLDAAAGIERMRSAIAGWQGKGMVVGTDGLLVVLAEGCLAAARRESPLGELNVAGDGALPDRSAAIVLEAIEPFLGPTVPCGQSFQAELLRMRGELLLARDGLAAADEALACFDHGLRLAREKGALAWELRAVMSIVRLRTRQGEAYVGELAEARTRLAEVYGRFAEGFAFPDLQDAAALLEVGERMS